MESFIKIINSLTPYVAFTSLGINIFIIVKGYIQGRMNIEISFPENYSTCLITDPSNPIQTYIFSVAVIISNNSTNPIVINSISLESSTEIFTSEFDSHHIGHSEANEMSLEGKIVWYRNEIRSTSLPVKLEAKTQELITFYFQTPLTFHPDKVILKTNKKDLVRDDIKSFIFHIQEKCNNRQEK